MTGRMSEKSQPLKYQAFGTVEGVLNLQGNHSTLLVGDVAFPIILYIPKQVRQSHLPGQIQRFRVFPGALHGKPALQLLKIAPTAPDGLKLKGCWEERWGVPYLVVYRNSLESPADRVLRILVPVTWENTPPTDGQFWELQAEIRGEQFHVIQAEGPFQPPPKATRYQPRPKSGTTPTPLTLEEIRDMTTPAKVQLTCKLNQVPAHRQLPDKKIEFFLSNASDLIFTVRMKPKQFKKLLNHGYENWVAAITGDMGEATATGFELINPALQVFEKKASSKPADQEQIPSPASSGTSAAVPKPPSSETTVKPASQRKSLLDGVTLR